MLEYPKIGEVFTLTGDFDLPENKPIGMAKSFLPDRKNEYWFWEDYWQYCALPLEGKHSRNFQLVQSSQYYFDPIKKELERKYGPTPPGMWMKIFHEEFPQHDGNGPIGIMDDSWKVDLYPQIPRIEENGKPGFSSTRYYLPVTWRWIVSA